MCIRRNISAIMHVVDNGWTEVAEKRGASVVHAGWLDRLTAHLDMRGSARSPLQRPEGHEALGMACISNMMSDVVETRSVHLVLPVLCRCVEMCCSWVEAQPTSYAREEEQWDRWCTDNCRSSGKNRCSSKGHTAVRTRKQDRADAALGSFLSPCCSAEPPLAKHGGRAELRLQQDCPAQTLQVDRP